MNLFVLGFAADILVGGVSQREMDSTSKNRRKGRGEKLLTAEVHGLLERLSPDWRKKEEKMAWGRGWLSK